MSRRHPGSRCTTRRRGHPGRAHVPRHHPGQPAVRPSDATEEELIEACQAAQIGDLVARCPTAWTPWSATAATGSPAGETAAGDRPAAAQGAGDRGARRGHRAPGFRVRGSGAAGAGDRAGGPDLAGDRAPAVHVREADQILVVDAGRVARARQHEELLAADGLYAELYHTQFARQERARPASARSDGPESAAVPPGHRAAEEAGPPATARTRPPGRTPPGLPYRRSGMPGRQLGLDLIRVAAAGVPARAPGRSRSEPGSRPLTRMPRGPSSSASVLATPARPGPRPLEIARSRDRRADRGGEHETDRAARGQLGHGRAPPTRTAPRNTLLERGPPGLVAAVWLIVPPGGPPTLISAPSRRPNALRVAAATGPGAAGSALSATTPHRPPGAGPPGSQPVCRGAHAGLIAAADYHIGTVTDQGLRRRPRPRPRLPPVTRYGPIAAVRVHDRAPARI